MAKKQSKKQFYLSKIEYIGKFRDFLENEHLSEFLSQEHLLGAEKEEIKRQMYLSLTRLAHLQLSYISLEKE